MGKDLQIFSNKEYGSIRIIEIETILWFVAADISKILDYSETSVMLRRLDEDETMKIVPTEIVGTSSMAREITLINESGLYNAVLGSHKSEAKKFKKWVTSEVLPQIRQTGGYIPSNEDDSDEDILAKALLIANKKIELKNKVIASKERQIQEQKPKVVFADAVATSSTSILVGELAKILKQNGINTGEKRLFDWLRKNGYLISRKGTDYNMPTQKSMELKLFEIKETSIAHSDGHITINKTTKVNGKGQIYFINKFKAA